ncbi:DNA cytosine methyltransferase [Vibrio harveyi]|nr:DNA cytosine methyltransferase [Vibrio harveyi]
MYNEEVISIGDMITNQLSNYYLIEHRILNFKNYGSNSSRTRTLVIGVCKNDSKFISPIELFPDFQQEVSLKDVIGNMKSLD